MDTKLFIGYFRCVYKMNRTSLAVNDNVCDGNISVLL